MTELSSGELNSLVKLASRGIGNSWGLAEEASFATRCLCDYKLSGVQTIAALFSQLDKLGLHSQRIVCEGSNWRGDDFLCPITTGAALSDFAHQLTDQASLDLKAVICPLVLLPFLLKMSEEGEHGIYLEWHDGLVCCHQGNVFSELQSSAIVKLLGCDASGKNIKVRSAPVTSAYLTNADDMERMDHAKPDLFVLKKAPIRRVRINPEQLQTLKGFAHRTYAPATEASRLSGAGAGTTDND